MKDAAIVPAHEWTTRKTNKRLFHAYDELGSAEARDSCHYTRTHRPSEYRLRAQTNRKARDYAGKRCTTDL